MELRQCHYRNVSQKGGRKGGEGLREEREERGQDINVHMPPLAQRFLFGFFHSSALQ